MINIISKLQDINKENKLILLTINSSISITCLIVWYFQLNERLKPSFKDLKYIISLM